VWGFVGGSGHLQTPICDAVSEGEAASFLSGATPCGSIGKSSSENRSKNAASLKGMRSMRRIGHSGN